MLKYFFKYLFDGSNEINGKFHIVKVSLFTQLHEIAPITIYFYRNAVGISTIFKYRFPVFRAKFKVSCYLLNISEIRKKYQDIRRKFTL